MDIFITKDLVECSVTIFPDNKDLLEHALVMTEAIDKATTLEHGQLVVKIYCHSPSDEQQLDAWFTAFCLVLAKMEEGEAAASEGAL